MSYTIVITEKGGKSRTEVFEQPEITIGRVQGNDIVLAKGNISKRHSRIVLRDGKFIIVDLKSTNGTYVNGQRISSPKVLKGSDKVYIGDFTLTLEGSDGAEAPGDVGASDNPSEIGGEPRGFHGDYSEGAGNEAEDPEGAEPALDPDPMGDPGEEVVPPGHGAGGHGAGGHGAGGHGAGGHGAPPVVQRPPEPQVAKKPPPPVSPPALAVPKAPTRPQQDVALPPPAALQARADVFRALTKALANDGGLPRDDDNTLEHARKLAEQTLNNVAKKFASVNIDGWPSQIAREVCGLGPLAELLEDTGVVEIFVNGPHQVLVRRAPDSSSVGVPLVASGTFFSSDEAVAQVIRRIMHTAGTKFDAENPIAEARLPDGTRVNAVHHSVAVRGPLVTVSRSSTRNATLDDLVAEGMLSRNMADFLGLCVRARRNICVCGGPGAQIGTVLSAMASTIEYDERIVVVEQVARLRLPQPHVVTLEPRPLRSGPSAVTVRDLVSNALRMRPNRVVVHEVTSGEAHDLFVAMGGRQDGTLFTTYASTTRDCLDRLETMIAMAGLDVQSRAVREQVASSLDLIVNVTRFADGSSRVTQISEVTGVEVDLVTTQDLFTFKREGVNDSGAVVGRFQATGSPPRFYDELQRRGDPVNLAIFRD